MQSWENLNLALYKQKLILEIIEKDYWGLVLQKQLGELQNNQSIWSSH